MRCTSTDAVPNPQRPHGNAEWPANHHGKLHRQVTERNAFRIVAGRVMAQRDGADTSSTQCLRSSGGRVRSEECSGPALGAVRGLDNARKRAHSGVHRAQSVPGSVARCRRPAAREQLDEHEVDDAAGPCRARAGADATDTIASRTRKWPATTRPGLVTRAHDRRAGTRRLPTARVRHGAPRRFCQGGRAARGVGAVAVEAGALGGDGGVLGWGGVEGPGDLLVLNTTRVRRARIMARRRSGAPVEVLFLHPAGAGDWLVMGKPGSALRPGSRIAITDSISIETREVLPEGYRRVRVVGTSPEDLMARFGRIPLPPYIGRDPAPVDEDRYQTVYAEREASVAAPTAGLHFTAGMLDRLVEQGVEVARIELEVGPGTFRPVESEDYTLHPMHAERYRVPPEAARAVARARERGGAVWAIGTTVVRTLEAAARPDGLVGPGEGETRLLITPGYEFKVVDRLLTNFHLPRSTLLLLVAAFAGYRRTMAAYRHAIERRYRFYSYGDAMAIV